MSSVSGVGGQSGDTSVGTRSSIGGIGVGSTTDTTGASINNIRGRVLDTFRESALRFTSVVSDVVSLKDRLESLGSVVDRLSNLAQRAADPQMTESDRLRINNEFQRGLREFQNIINESGKTGIDLSKSDSLTRVLREADIDLSYSLETPSILRNAIIGSSRETSSTSIYSQRIDTAEKAEAAENILDRAKRILARDYDGVSNAYSAMERAYELSARAYTGMLQLSASGVSSFDQLALKLSSEIRGRTKDFLIGMNSPLDRDLVDSITRR
jgi:hypothetical protein